MAAKHRSDRKPEARVARVVGRLRPRIRGQGLVEFALVLPVLLMLLMVAIDFGRVYLGWVNLQNMARIAANYASNNANGFQTNDAGTLAVYMQTIKNDAAATNCQLKSGAAGVTTTFSGYNVGDTVSVSLTCSFGVITPIISNVLGNNVNVSASSQFPIKTGIIAATNTGGGGGGGGTTVTASFSCTPTTGTVPLTVQCNDESGGSPTTWQWTINGPSGSVQTSGIRDPVFVLPAIGSYSVTLVADNALNTPSTLVRGGYISVGVPSAVDLGADKVTGTAPLLVKFTDLSSGSPTAWAWDFTNDGTVDSTLQNPQFTYSTAGSKDVKLTVTNASGTASRVKIGFIVVGAPNCTVPPFTGVKRNSAPGVWTTPQPPNGAFFTGPLTDVPGAPNGNYTIGFQSITPGSIVPCTSGIQVNK